MVVVGRPGEALDQKGEYIAPLRLYLGICHRAPSLLIFDATAIAVYVSRGLVVSGWLLHMNEGEVWIDGWLVVEEDMEIDLTVCIERLPCGILRERSNSRDCSSYR